MSLFRYKTCKRCRQYIIRGGNLNGCWDSLVHVQSNSLLRAQQVPGIALDAGPAALSRTLLGKFQKGVVGSDFNFTEGWVGSGTGRVESGWYSSTCAQSSIGCVQDECSSGRPPTYKLVKGTVHKTSFYRACDGALGAV